MGALGLFAFSLHLRQKARAQKADPLRLFFTWPSDPAAIELEDRVYESKRGVYEGYLTPKDVQRLEDAEKIGPKDAFLLKMIAGFAMGKSLAIFRALAHGREVKTPDESEWHREDGDSAGDFYACICLSLDLPDADRKKAIMSQVRALVILPGEQGSKFKNLAESATKSIDRANNHLGQMMATLTWGCFGETMLVKIEDALREYHEGYEKAFADEPGDENTIDANTVARCGNLVDVTLLNIWFAMLEHMKKKARVFEKKRLKESPGEEEREASGCGDIYEALGKIQLISRASEVHGHPRRSLVQTFTVYVYNNVLEVLNLLFVSRVSRDGWAAKFLEEAIERLEPTFPELKALLDRPPRGRSPVEVAFMNNQQRFAARGET